MKRHPIALATLLVLIATLVNAVTASAVRFAFIRGVTSTEILFLRNLFAFFTLSPWFFYPRNLKNTCTISSPWLHLFRGVVTVFSIWFYYISLSLISVAEATLLYFTIPLFIPFIGWIWKRDPIEKHNWWGMLLGFSGIILIIRPGTDLFHYGALIALVAGFLGALGQYSVHLLHKTESARKITLKYFIIAIVIAFLLTLFAPQTNWGSIEWKDIPVLILLGVAAAMYSICILFALKYMPPNYVTMFLFLAVPWNALVGWWLWGEVPTLIGVLGFLFVLLGVAGVVFFVSNQARKKH